MRHPVEWLRCRHSQAQPNSIRIPRVIWPLCDTETHVSLHLLHHLVPADMARCYLGCWSIEWARTQTACFSPSPTVSSRDSRFCNPPSMDRVPGSISNGRRNRTAAGVSERAHRPRALYARNIRKHADDLRSSTHLRFARNEETEPIGNFYTFCSNDKNYVLGRLQRETRERSPVFRV